MKHRNTKPLVVVAGDAAQSAYILVPHSEDPNDWNYDATPFHNCHATVGGIAVGDVDGTFRTF
jgi:predicted lipoprotein with Yx(FWY)xxD motif